MEKKIEISDRGLAGCLTFLAARTIGQTPPPGSVVADLNKGWGHIAAAVIERDSTGAPYVSLTMTDQHHAATDGALRTPRILDVEGFIAVRLLLAPGAQFRTDRPDDDWHMIAIHDDINVRRLIAGAGAGQIAKDARGPGGHYDLRRSNTYVANGHAHQDRKLAVQKASNLFVGSDLTELMSVETYKALIWQSFDLLDTLPLATGPIDTMAVAR
jgi:hypothetical protein